VRHRLMSNVLTIADIMEVQCTTAEQRHACATLRQQAVMQYDPQALGDQQSCSLCLQRFNAMEEITRTLCGHLFHSQCLGSWLQTQTGQQSNPTCPLCRGELAVGLPPLLASIVPGHESPHEVAQMVGATRFDHST